MKLQPPEDPKNVHGAFTKAHEKHQLTVENGLIFVQNGITIVSRTLKNPHLQLWFAIIRHIERELEQNLAPK